ncbi:MAG: glutamine--fructose-6-phosphate transaminase (isomerizing) [Armatimonadota bacterium]
MCGIVGYVGTDQAAAVCLAGLRRLEYRGYDSAGVAVLRDGQLDVRKTVGKLKVLAASLEEEPLESTIGIGHTRWATHGRPSTDNSHPHLDCTGQFAVVHNGIIENYAELREQLQAEGHEFSSQTDTEIIAHLLEKYFEGDLVAALRRAASDLDGAYAVAAISTREPEVIAAVRKRSPLVVGLGQGENFVASDMLAVRERTDRVYVLDNDQFVRATRDAVELFDSEGQRIEREAYHIEWDTEAIEKRGYKHFMLKEIHEQPAVLRDCLSGRLTAGAEAVSLPELNMSEDDIKSLQKIVFTACGTAYHAGMYGRFAIERLAGIPCEVDLASEMRARDPVVPENTLAIVISQSGETADSLEALLELREKGARIGSIVNVVDSAIARESDWVCYIKAGVEIGVASTKAYTLQALICQLLGIHFAEVRGTQPPAYVAELRSAISRLPEQLEEVLAGEDHVKYVAEQYQWMDDCLYLGRGANFCSALEGALKLKEISYIHAEGYAAGEMKHGPIALIEPDCPTVAIAVEGEVYDKMIGNLQEVKARDGKVIAVAFEGDENIVQHADEVIRVPRCPEILSPIPVQLPLQLLAYHIADLRGCDIDQPRNLAKTVTVE